MAPRKRRNSNPLAAVNEPRWIKTYDRCGRELTSRRIEPCADLRKVISDEAKRWADDGWTVESDGAWGEFFVNRNEERIEVRLSRAEHPMQSHSSASFGPQKK